MGEVDKETWGKPLPERNHIFQTLSVDVCPNKRCFPICECIYIKNLKNSLKMKSHLVICLTNHLYLEKENKIT